MKKKRKNNKNNNTNLIRLFEHHTPLNRQNFLNKIDKILCVYLKLKQKDLPWLNPLNNRQKWLKLSSRLRLIVGKIEYENDLQKNRTIH